MRKKVILIFTALVVIFTSCVKDLNKEGISSTTLYKGRVIEKSKNAPIQGVMVSVSDGTHVHASVVTDEDGRFEMEVSFDELNENYKLHLDCQNYPSITEELKGMGQDVFDYRDIIFFDNDNPDNWPNITTVSVTNINGNSAKCGGVIVYSGAAPITARGVCWSESQEPTINDDHTSDGTGIGSFASDINNLTSNTNYYVRAYATNQHGTYYGNLVRFSTTMGLPSVLTTEPTLSGSIVTTGGNVINDDGVTVLKRGVCYGLSPNPSINGNHTEDGSGMGVFTSTFVITQSGTYYIRAYATNANGTSYGEQKTIIYLDLPTFQFDGHTYWVAPDPGNKMNYEVAADYCYNYGIHGTSGWKLPTMGELIQMYTERESIGGFVLDIYWSNTLHSSPMTGDRYYTIDFSSGSTSVEQYNYYCRVRPIKQID